MADDNYIEIIARLDKGASIDMIQKDLFTVAKKVLLQLHHVEVSQAGTKSLQASINDIQRNLSLSIGNVSIDQSQTAKQAQQISQNLASAMNITPNLGNTKRAFEEIQAVIEALNPGEHAKIFGDLDSLSAFVHKALPDFQEINTSINSWYKGTEEEIERVRAFTAEVRNADGVVEKLSFRLANIGSEDKTPVWQFSNATATDNAIKLQEQLEKQIAKSSNTSLKLTNNLEGVKRKLSDVLQVHGNDTNITTYLNQAVDAITKLNSADSSNFDKLKINAENAIRTYTDYLNKLKTADVQAEQSQRRLDAQLVSTQKTLDHNVMILGNLSKNSIFSKNATSPEVVTMQSNIDKLRESYQNLKTSSKDAVASPDLINTFKTLNTEIVDTIVNSQKLAKTLGDKTTNVVPEVELNNLKTLMNNLKASDVEVDKLKADYGELVGLMIQAQDTGDWSNYLRQLDIFKSKFAEAKSEVRATTAATSDLEKMVKSLTSNKMNTFFDKNSDNAQVNALKTEINGLINEWTALNAEIETTGHVTHSMQGRLDELRVKMQNATTAADTLQKNIKEVANAQRLATQKQSLDTRITSWLQNNTRASQETITKLKEMQAQIQNADHQTMANLNNQFREVTANARAAGEAGMRMGDIIKQKLGKFAGWFSIATVVMRSVNELKNMYRTVVELDSAMVGLRKVSDETEQAYNNFFATATKNAKELGTTITDVINSTTEFARLGYNLADATKLSEVATLYKNVGDGIDIDQATSSIISTMKAFNITADNTMEIVDKYNKVGRICCP